MEKLGELEDPRQPSNGKRHDFREILVIAVCAMLSDADSFEDIALWGRLKADWLRRFLVLQNGIPSQDTFLRVFRVLDPKQFEAVFRRWVGGIVGALDGMVAVDGKTLRPRVRQLRSQVLVFARAHFQKCHYNSASCSGVAGFSIPKA